MTKNRLSKILASAGVASRRKAEELISAGSVTVNGVVTKVPQTMVTLGVDTITVNGKPIAQAETKVYYMLNKPVGYHCTAAPLHGRRVIDLFTEAEERRLFTVGRLDKNTTGLLLVTNDGQFANRVIHPSNNIEKEYVAKADQEITAEHLIAISKGARIEGIFVKPLSVKKVRRATIKIIVGEGKKREIRELLERVGLQVQELTRIRIGRLLLGPLPIGQFRPLTAREKELIFE